MDWLECWATRRQIQEAALAVWDGGCAGTHLARARPELSQFAWHHGLSLIFDDSALIEDKSSMVASDQMPLHILEPPGRNQFRNWGIND
jgi:hypothetical protein